jgi:hypothetical protein
MSLRIANLLAVADGRLAIKVPGADDIRNRVMNQALEMLGLLS